VDVKEGEVVTPDEGKIKKEVEDRIETPNLPFFQDHRKRCTNAITADPSKEGNLSEIRYKFSRK
jgi:hypothetical protein